MSVHIPYEHMSIKTLQTTVLKEPYRI